MSYKRNQTRYKRKNEFIHKLHKNALELYEKQLTQPKTNKSLNEIINEFFREIGMPVTNWIDVPAEIINIKNTLKE